MDGDLQHLLSLPWRQSPASNKHNHAKPQFE